jgi:hypothetical protein
MSSKILAWRYAADSADVEVRTEEGWVLYSTGRYVEDDLAALKTAGVPQE